MYYTTCLSELKPGFTFVTADKLLDRLESNPTHDTVFNITVHDSRFMTECSEGFKCSKVYISLPRNLSIPETWKYLFSRGVPQYRSMQICLKRGWYDVIRSTIASNKKILFATLLAIASFDDKPFLKEIMGWHTHELEANPKGYAILNSHLLSK